MKIGNRNRRFGWVWLAVGMILGATIEIRLFTDPSYAESFAGTSGIAQVRELWRAAHAHVNVLALMNLLYAMYIDKAVLSDGLKNLGSWLALLGAISLPAGLFLASFVLSLGILAPLGGLLLIAGIIIMAVGHLRLREMQS